MVEEIRAVNVFLCFLAKLDVFINRNCGEYGYITIDKLLQKNNKIAKRNKITY